MKVAAGIAGILLGIFSLTYVGIFGTMVGAAAGFLGSIPFQGNNLGGWAEMTKILSWLAPLATIVGGIATFGNPLVGGVILGAAALLHWHLLGLGLIGKLFVLPIGATAALAFFASSSTRSVTAPSAPTPASTEPDTHASVAQPTFDRAKWNALIQYDKEIAAVADRLRPLGEAWLDEFASSFLTLNDKAYLPAIEEKIAFAAAAATDAERQRKEEARIRVQEETARQRREEERRREDLAKSSEARRKSYEAWQARIWGSTQRKAVTLLIASATLLALVILSQPPDYAEPRDWAGMLEGIINHRADLGSAENAWTSSISLNEDNANSRGEKSLHWDVTIYDNEKNDLGLHKQRQFALPASGVVKPAMLGSVQVEASRSGSEECDSRIWIADAPPIGSHFNCDSNSGMNYSLMKSPSSRFAALGISTYGGQDEELSEVYSVDLMKHRAIRIEQAKYVAAISRRGNRILIFVDGLPQIVNLTDGRRFESAPMYRTGILSTIKQIQNNFVDFSEARFVDDQGIELIYGPTKCRSGKCAQIHLKVTESGIIVVGG